ncbi:aldose epimerase family protein [Thermoclostridium caenicola]|uniref:Aldose 1-epimerase n=1 Tax=Thermoclostridium caenicola TaxID=659425 RepID=A0A1M6DBW7_9FIRM|nr:aldose epimerase family protein [Thermoclostridium caenicola]SHI70561.1 aldose 1-epimerase [Thermoclostridium caenicola]HOL83758.1 aldose epimerase family protein [Thermoclostridium caenicola]HOP72416.1 aldose epimerase family protein [Thermoclostridium caenicola]HPO75994.1 aldose epimerase family protein [Thermoclostridium caenicola]HPU22012.1 aldose epimerase family protein [Thermoclostridium caenicola]
MRITKKPFGKINNEEIHLYSLVNSNGMRADIINFGGTIVSLYTPDRNGHLQDITLGYDKLEDYVRPNPFFGAIIGRHANRLEDASFTLNGVFYQLNRNEGNNQLHGGLVGFDKKVWTAEIIGDSQQESLRLKYLSPDMEENYPGNLDVTVTYTLTEQNELVIDYHAVSDKDTVVNLTNHAYFNLSGHDSGAIYEHQLMINARRFTPISEACLPTGEIRDVAGTPFDFTSMKAVGKGLLECMDDEQMRFGSGYDHNFVLDVSGKAPEKAAEVYDPKSGRVMEVYTTKPGVQFYTGNHLNETGKGGAVYKKHGGLCLETQYFPNSMKHTHFPSPILRAGEIYHHITIYKFGAR